MRTYVHAQTYVVRTCVYALTYPRHVSLKANQCFPSTYKSHIIVTSKHNIFKLIITNLNNPSVEMNSAVFHITTNKSVITPMSAVLSHSQTT